MEIRQGVPIDEFTLLDFCNAVEEVPGIADLTSDEPDALTLLNRLVARGVIR